MLRKMELNPDLLDMEVGTIISEVKELVSKYDSEGLSKLFINSMDSNTEAYFDTIYQYLDTVIVKAFSNPSDAKTIFVHTIRDLLSICEMVRGQTKKGLTARLIYYVSYYFILSSVKCNDKHHKFLNDMNNKLNEFIDGHDTKFVFSDTETISYRNFIDTMLDVHKQL